MAEITYLRETLLSVWQVVSYAGGKKKLMPVTEMIRSHIDRGGPGAQAALARRLKVKEATVSRWVNGESIPSEDRAGAIAAAIGSDEATVLAAIGLARQHRYQAKKIAAAKAAETETVRDLTAKLAEVFARIEVLERQIAEERRRH